LSQGLVAEGERYLKSAASSGDRETALELADHYVATKRYAEAIAILDNLSGDEPPGSLSLRRADIEFRQGQREASLRRIDQLLTRIPGHGRAMELKAAFLLEMDQPGEAFRWAREAVAAVPASATAQFVLARVLAATGAVEESFAAASEAVRLDPLSRPAGRLLARTALEMNRLDMAVDLSRVLLRGDAQDEEATTLLVTGLLRRGDLPAADSALESGLAMFPQAPALLARKGDVLAARDAHGARAAYQRALVVDPKNPEAVTGLVRLDIAEGRAGAARQRLEALLAAEPNHPDFLVLLGQTLQTLGDVGGSERAYRRVIGRSPRHVQASLALTGLLRDAGRSDEARVVLEQLLEKRPSAVEARLTVAAMLEAEGRLVDAQGQYERILADDSRSAVAAYRLASLHVDLGENLDVALDLASRAVLSLPQDPRANDVIGWIYVRKNLPRSAVPHLEQSVRTAPHDPVFRYHLGMAYAGVGQPQKARSELRRALALDPTFRYAAQAKAALDAASR
jgi:tetratricopeptide (TPR) repeat protein